MRKIAAIDTGSNAIRLALADVDEEFNLEAVDCLREPIRLGRDVFMDGILYESTIQQTVEAFKRFKNISDLFHVTEIKAVGTSAMREAQNASVLIDRIEIETGIRLEVISEQEEARLVHQAVASAMDLRGNHVILVDIGGGSIEVTHTRNGELISTHSYALGTVRLLQRLQRPDEHYSAHTFSQLLRGQIEDARQRIKEDIGGEKVDLLVGTGGNAVAIGKLCRRLFDLPDERSVPLDKVGRLLGRLSEMNIEDRMVAFKLRPDRADVILPAALILHLIGGISHADRIHLPDVGLKNGLLLDMAWSMAAKKYGLEKASFWVQDFTGNEV